MRARRIVRFLKQRYRIEHRFKSDPFKVLVSCIISQRTKEENTEKASEALFAVADSPESLAKLPIKEIEKAVKPSGTFRQKARRIKEVAKIIVEKYKGKVPKDRDALLSLPGVGWKTSAVVLSYGFGIPIIAVDTHVNRISKRLGIADEKDDVETVRKKLESFFDKKDWLVINLGFVNFGREICRPRNPKCEICPFKDICDYYKKRYD